MVIGHGYSRTPLAKKLGIRNGFTASLVNSPDHYFTMFDDLPAGLVISYDPAIPKDFIHFFAQQKEALHTQLPRLKDQLKPNGMIWVSWPKKTSGVVTDVTEHEVRGYAIAIGLVDIKVCTIDETWSALKLVIPVKSR